MLPSSNIICNDYSGGLENIPITVVNDVDDEEVPKVEYKIKRFSDIPNIRALMQNLPTCPGCDCEDDCQNSHLCKCQSIDRWPSEFKTAYLKSDKNNTTTTKNFASVFECNKNCKCSSSCPNKVVQKGLQIPLQIFKTPKSGWGVRTLVALQQGSFITTYIGRIMTSEYLTNILSIFEKLKVPKEKIAREKMHVLYLSEIAGSKDADAPPARIFVCDAGKAGNVARFFNHSCDPNMVAEDVYVENMDLRLPEVAFYAKRDIKAGEELTWDYGFEPGENKTQCGCGAEKCRGKIFQY